jgi:hypothetical protein
MLSADPQIETIGAGGISAKVPLHKFSTLAIGGVEQPGVQFDVLARPLAACRTEAYS